MAIRYPGGTEKKSSVQRAGIWEGGRGFDIGMAVNYSGGREIFLIQYNA